LIKLAEVNVALIEILVVNQSYNSEIYKIHVYKPKYNGVHKIKINYREFRNLYDVGGGIIFIVRDLITIKLKNNCIVIENEDKNDVVKLKITKFDIL
jgi:hypothetical protein